MKKVYVYQGQTYDSAYAVRQALYKAERLAFGPEPDEGRADFWQALGVEYSEVDNSAEEFLALKQEKLDQLRAQFNSYLTSKNTYIQSSLGFKVNANQTAYMNLDSLIFQAEASPEEGGVEFNDFDNALHTLNVNQLKTIKLEIARSISDAYSKKWALRSEIEAAESADALGAINLTFGEAE